MRKPIDNSLVEYLSKSQWALQESVLRPMADLVMMHAAGTKVSAVQIQAVTQARDERVDARDAERSTMQLSANDFQFNVIDGIAVVPIHGVIAKRASMVNGVSQERGTSCEQIAATISAAIEEPQVGAIMLDIDSPGGSADGVADLADFLHEAADEKPIVAQCDGCMASAAYWIGSQANSIYTSQTGIVGSIGVYTVIPDFSRWFDEEAKTKVHVVRAGEKKGIGVMGAEVTESDLAEIQRGVDAVYGVFVSAVSRGLDISREAALALADGRVHYGQEAVDIGLADGVQSFDETLTQLAEEHGRSRFSPPNPTRR